jgi:ribosomal RNA-processing protein 7
MQKISDFSILPVAYSSQATHYIYIRAHITKSKGGASDEFPSNRTLFAVNIPPDASERELVTLFLKYGTVERIAFAGHDRVEEIIHEEVATSDEEKMDAPKGNEVEMLDNEDEEEDKNRRRQKKRKNETAKANVPKITPLPTVSLRHLRRTGGIGHIVFRTSQALAAILALSKSDLPLAWPKFKVPSGAEPSGLAHYVAKHKSLRPPLSVVKAHADSSMEVFEYKQALANRNTSKYRKGEAIIDEDGFTLVARGGAYGQTIGGGVGVASKKFMQEVTSGKRNRKKKSAYKEGFYAFQTREKRIQGILLHLLSFPGNI